MLVTPNWPGSGFLAVVEDRVRSGRMRVLERFAPVLSCPKEIVSNTFRGVPKFKMVLYEFNF